MVDTGGAREQAREAAVALATQRLPVFLRTSPLEVLVGIAVAVLGVLDGGLIGSALVGLGVLLVAWTTATGVASARTAATLQAAEQERLDALGQRLLVVDEQLAGAVDAPQEDVRTTLLGQARRWLSLALADMGVTRTREPVLAPEPQPSPIELVAQTDAPAPSIRSVPDGGAVH